MLLHRYIFPPARNVYAKTTERWAAYVDNSTGYGLGVFVPAAWTGITGYRTGPDNSDRPYDCSYFAHTFKMALTPRLPPYRYQAFITVGRLDEIRSTFNRLAADPKILPPHLTKDIAQYLKAPEELVEGQPDVGRPNMDGRLPMEDGEEPVVHSDDGTSDEAADPPQGAPASAFETDVLTRAGAGASGAGGMIKVGAATGVSDDASAGNDSSEKKQAMKVLAAVVAAVGGVALVGVGVVAAAVQKKRRSQERAAGAYSQEAGVAGAASESAVAAVEDKGVASEAVLEGDGGSPAGPRAAADVAG
jgi:hypothetical protein